MYIFVGYFQDHHCPNANQKCCSVNGGGLMCLNPIAGTRKDGECPEFWEVKGHSKKVYLKLDHLERCGLKVILYGILKHKFFFDGFLKKTNM